MSTNEIMSFEEFIKTKIETKDLLIYAYNGNLDIYNTDTDELIYETVHIFKEKDGTFTLTIFNEIYCDKLEALEPILYKWAMDEGILDKPQTNNNVEK